MESPVFAAIRFSAGCPDCGAEAECWGTQALVGGLLRWDTESVCPDCRFTVVVCDDDVPAGMRERILSEHGPARLQVGPAAGNVMIMRVLRTALGSDLGQARKALHLVLAGEWSGTLPEMEFLARRLRAAGIEAVAVRS
ncbi:hypothetical protein ACFQ6U_01265 [Streptomyces sp. NPDC056465]|uniref:hypothetical protein n=1 Tax=unclassified Streptomyces TaxID=2593676 RepID=UPI0035DF5D77